KNRSLVCDYDFNREEIIRIFETAKRVKAEVKSGKLVPYLAGKTMGMIFEKSSTRTRVSFEVGMLQLGGSALFLSSKDIQLGRGETIQDTARVLSRYLDIIMARTFEHSKVEDLAKYGDIPVINGLTDLLHPCQALTDYYTAYEKGKKLEGMKFTYVGDGNNMAHSLLLTGAILGCHVCVACPTSMTVNADIVKKAQQLASVSGGSVLVTTDAKEACKDADVVYTDVWASMGQEAEFKEKEKVLRPYQVNKELFALAKKDAFFMHCLPAHRGEEVTVDVIDGPNSVIFDEAENRLHVQKAIVLFLMGK
ncbi:MAG TPA: ornithine carbamoyltransferase, partial [bacterium]|nr:ornithine carbamoyltransferase [bacterium]